MPFAKPLDTLYHGHATSLSELRLMILVLPVVLILNNADFWCAILNCVCSKKLMPAGYRSVYPAYHVPSGKILAVKVIPLDITLELQKQIMSELEILYKCDSSYIIGFYGAFFVENRISLCTEFMDGGSLDVYRKIPEHVLGRIAVAVVKGLTYLWSLKILHRDVKPSNMLVNTRGQVKLCDFGVSTQLVNSIAKTYVGTNAYMAPERISGEQYGIHSDVWSLGISFMELALGRFPYPQIQKNQGSLMPLQLLQCIVDEESPVLPAGEFSEPFVHFITQ
ncbi:PREDICTED: dual specificity mitogen-activated protein kinase kinase 5, partial [Phaethon lepturus]|uniref:dual specificity mitogen-activated protein kinase kinase 5 n=1 Tax=Phaethon lepturus TaxID=97097 RepID=UPI0005309A0B